MKGPGRVGGAGLFVSYGVGLGKESRSRLL
jgi:hypothetical protein